MTPTFASIAITVALLAGDGLGSGESVASADPASGRIFPTIDVPAPRRWELDHDVRRGGQAARIEFEDPSFNDALSVWYRLAYVDGGTRLQVFEHYAIGTLGPDSDIALSEKKAWTVANEVVGPQPGATAFPQSPNWPRVRTGNTTGPSAGLIFTLGYIDLLTSGALVGDLRVAGTGGIAPNGHVFSVSGVEVKVATAVLARPDVIFTPRPSKLIEHTTEIDSESNRHPPDGSTLDEWLNLNAYEQAGRDAASHPGTTAFVVVHDIRQALAWLCGRTDIETTCAIAHRSANLPIGAGSPNQPSSIRNVFVR